MKRIKLLSIICLAFLSITSCIENEPDIVDLPNKDVDFYYIGQSINYVIKEEISFVNTSIIGTNYRWDFGDGASSNEKNSVHKYEEPGTYTVKLSVDNGTYSVSKQLMISDIVPRIFVSSEEGLDKYVYNKTTINFDAYVDNPEDSVIYYSWIFPGGTQGEGIDQNGRSTQKELNAVFDKFGTLEVTLQVSLGTKTLDPITKKVNVHYDKPAKTLYYAAKDGNIMAKKIVDGLEEGINNPFDTQYKAGKHALTLLYFEDWLYVLDAGSKIGYVEKPEGLGDGEIFVISSDWSSRETVIENYNGDSYFDFFYGYIDEDQSRLHFLDRREGVRWIPLNTRNAKFDDNIYPYWVKNDRTGYYGNGISFGHVNGPLFRYNGLWHWAKNSNGSGLYRFTESDVDRADVPSAGVIMPSRRIRGLAVDEANNHIYFSDNSLYRIIRSDLDTGSNSRMIDDSTTDAEGGGSEALFVTGMSLDLDAGYLYWAYRGPVPEGDEDEYYSGAPLARSGIKRIKLSDITEDMATNKSNIEYFVEGVDAYGVTIDHTLR